MVATVAFGMGLDALHVQSVIHLAMPRSLEEYVQQVKTLKPCNWKTLRSLVQTEAALKLPLQALVQYLPWAQQKGHQKELSLTETCALRHTIWGRNLVGKQS